jgi:hypothetical protein
VVAEKLIPKTYPYGTKRQPLDTNYFETFNKKNVLLVDASTDGPIEEITPNGIRAGGKEYPVDIIVIATGFDAMTGPLNNLGIKGRGGRELAQDWRDGPQTYLGLAVAGFPNLFTITGPQSPSVLSNMPVSIEQHVEWITLHAQKQAHDDRGDSTGAGRVGCPCRRGRERDADDWHRLLVHGSQHRGEAAPLPALSMPRRRRGLSQEVRRNCRKGIRGVRVRQCRLVADFVAKVVLHKA